MVSPESGIVSRRCFKFQIESPVLLKTYYLQLTTYDCTSTIPYDHWVAESESIFHIIAHLSFRKLGLDIRSEPHSSKGRCDIVIITEKYIYALELKLNSTAAIALQQILQKEYLRPYQLDPRQKIAIGINFSSKERKVTGYETKEL